MSWVRLDDQFHNHPKLPMLGAIMLPCIGLHTLALSWCSAYLTDGVIPRDQIPRLSGDVSAALKVGTLWEIVDRLVAVKLWEHHGDNYLIHDYLEYNPSKRDVLKLRKTRAELGQKGGKQKASNMLSKQPSKLLANDVANDVANAKQKSTPSPVPYPRTEKTKNLVEDSASTKGKKSTDPNIKGVIDHYHQTFVASFKSPPPLNGAKCGAIAKKLLAGRTLEEAKWLVTEHLSNPPDFYEGKNLYGLEHVLSAAQTLLARRAKSKGGE